MSTIQESSERPHDVYLVTCMSLHGIRHISDVVYVLLHLPCGCCMRVARTDRHIRTMMLTETVIDTSSSTATTRDDDRAAATLHLLRFCSKSLPPVYFIIIATILRTLRQSDATLYDPVAQLCLTPRTSSRHPRNPCFPRSALRFHLQNRVVTCSDVSFAFSSLFFLGLCLILVTR